MSLTASASRWRAALVAAAAPAVTVSPAGSKGFPYLAAAYRTRLLVRRPSNPARFNGTVVVEWLNVTSGTELSARLLVDVGRAAVRRPRER